MEFIGVATYQDSQWKTLWLGPKTLFRSSMRLPVLLHRDGLMSLQDSKCNYCRDPIRIYPSANCDCDHIIPVKYGGSCDLHNLQLLCVSCHRLKSRMERKKVSRVVNIDGATDGRLYVVCGDSEVNHITGKVQPGDFMTLTAGAYEVSSILGVTRDEYRGSKRKRCGRGCHISKRNKCGDTNWCLPKNLSHEDAIFFKKHQRAIVNRLMYIKYPKITRQKLLANRTEMCVAHHHLHMDMKCFDVFDFITNELGLESLSDTKTFDWAAIVESGSSDTIQEALDTIDMFDSTHACSSDLLRLRRHFKTILGYNVSAFVKRTRHDGTRTSYLTYYFSDMLGPILDRLEDEWIQQCIRPICSRQEPQE